MHRLLWRLILFAFILADLALSTGALGFYQLDFNFSWELMVEKLLLTNGYHFCTGGLEFVILAVFRSVVLIAGVIASCYVTVPPMKLVFFDLVLWSTSFGLIEALAFSELPHQLAFCGIWLSIVWNWIAFPVAHALWHTVVYIKPPSECRTTEDDRDLLILDEDGEEEEPEASSQFAANERPLEAELSTFNALLRLLYYCRYGSKVFGLGLVFLFAYSGGMLI